LSLLISNSLCAYEELDELDAHWDWDIVFNQVASNLANAA
jgi:hypothetical protein